MAGAAKTKFPLSWVAAVVAATLPLFVVFALHGEEGRGRAAALSLGMLAVCAKVRWELHRRTWFWATLAAIAVLHVPLVLYVPWTSQWVPAVVSLPICIADGAVTLWVLRTMEKWMATSEPTHAG